MPMSSEGDVGTQSSAGSWALGEEREAPQEDKKHAPCAHSQGPWSYARVSC